MLAKYGVLIAGLRGERVIRRNATFELDPLTRRINRCGAAYAGLWWKKRG